MPLMTFSASGQLIAHEKEPEIRPVGGMTRTAFSFFDQGMLILIILLPHVLLGVLMAMAACFTLFSFLEVALVRGMGAVAVHAKHTFYYVAVYLLKIFLCGWMAGKTSSCPLILET